MKKNTKSKKTNKVETTKELISVRWEVRGTNVLQKALHVWAIVPESMDALEDTRERARAFLTKCKKETTAYCYAPDSKLFKISRYRRVPMILIEAWRPTIEDTCDVGTRALGAWGFLDKRGRYEWGWMLYIKGDQHRGERRSKPEAQAAAEAIFGLYGFKVGKKVTKKFA
jgi:hypothetical protein